MTKAQMQERINELEEHLNVSNESYTRLSKQYRDLNESKGDVIGYEQLKSSFECLTSRYEDLKKSSEKTIGREKKRNDDLVAKYKKLQEEYNILQTEYQKLIIDTKRERIHNERGAGRKPSEERKQAIKECQKLISENVSEEEIMQKLGISRATYYRYKKSINN